MPRQTGTSRGCSGDCKYGNIARQENVNGEDRYRGLWGASLGQISGKISRIHHCIHVWFRYSPLPPAVGKREPLTKLDQGSNRTGLACTNECSGRTLWKEE